jgi:hypothetical protein
MDRAPAVGDGAPTYSEQGIPTLSIGNGAGAVLRRSALRGRRRMSGMDRAPSVGGTRERSLPQCFLPTANRNAAPSYAASTYEFFVFIRWAFIWNDC